MRAIVSSLTWPASSRRSSVNLRDLGVTQSLSSVLASLPKVRWPVHVVFLGGREVSRFLPSSSRRCLRNCRDTDRGRAAGVGREARASDGVVTDSVPSSSSEESGRFVKDPARVAEAASSGSAPETPGSGVLHWCVPPGGGQLRHASDRGASSQKVRPAVVRFLGQILFSFPKRVAKCGTRLVCTTEAMDQAAAMNYLDAAMRFNSNRTEGCTTGALDYAASGDHLKCSGAAVALCQRKTG
ncbi:hypothetical protein ON010_g14860 [Phytophthora cinnamomi]|nr:hypothetical protein ON010_g14860 [Phytophthora cinnamomi]